ncbi:MAG: hypothetical protein JWP69_1332 [Flaviaesturariibacter sp.]|nr:hypothetical protein [Flaviaesturariibacter sp.]
MSKWADYIITGVWYADGHISHVFLHPDNGEKHMTTGSKKTRQQVINLLKAGHTVMTGKWAYVSHEWTRGVQVDHYTRNNVEYLRTHPDETKSDNLENMLPLSEFGL